MKKVLVFSILGLLFITLSSGKVSNRLMGKWRMVKMMDKGNTDTFPKEGPTMFLEFMEENKVNLIEGKLKSDGSFESKGDLGFWQYEKETQSLYLGPNEERAEHMKLIKLSKKKLVFGPHDDSKENRAYFVKMK